MGVCNQITLLILYYISSRLVTLLKSIVAPIHFSDILHLTVSFKFINFSSQMFLIFFLKYVLASRLIFFRLSTLLWFGSCNHYFLNCSLLSKKPKDSSSNLGVCCFISYTPRLSLTEDFIFS